MVIYYWQRQLHLAIVSLHFKWYKNKLWCQTHNTNDWLKISPLSELETWLTLNVLPTLRDKDIGFKYQEQGGQSVLVSQSYKISNIFAWVLVFNKGGGVGGQKICNLDTVTMDKITNFDGNNLYLWSNPCFSEGHQEYRRAVSVHFWICYFASLFSPLIKRC